MLVGDSKVLKIVVVVVFAVNIEKYSSKSENFEGYLILYLTGVLSVRPKLSERKKADHWFLAAVGLALVPRTIIEDTWAEIMDLYTPDHAGATEFNDYLVQTYVDSDVSLFNAQTWNVNDAIQNNLPRTNNHVEGYNKRLESNFPVHPHIYEFVRLLRDEHSFQHHQAEA
ncbi:unnamed protein product, partial [Didymodactylos carnosus]